MTLEEAHAQDGMRQHGVYRDLEILQTGRDGWLREDPARQNWLLTLTAYAPRLHSLYITRQNIDDAFIQRLSQQGFERITQLSLRGNAEITRASLEYILQSDTLGSLRELPQLSGKYNKPSSEINVRVEETGVTRSDMEYFNANPRFNFTIRYRRIFDDVQISPTVRGGIKWVRVEM